MFKFSVSARARFTRFWAGFRSTLSSTGFSGGKIHRTTATLPGGAQKKREFDCKRSV